MANVEAFSDAYSKGAKNAFGKKPKDADKDTDKDKQTTPDKGGGKVHGKKGSSGGSSGGGNPYSILSWLPKMGAKHKGGMVKKTGPYRLKKGERVMTSKQQESAGMKKHRKTTRKRVVSKR